MFQYTWKLVLVSARRGQRLFDKFLFILDFIISFIWP